MTHPAHRHLISASLSLKTAFKWMLYFQSLVLKDGKLFFEKLILVDLIFELRLAAHLPCLYEQIHIFERKCVETRLRILVYVYLSNANFDRTLLASYICCSF